MHEVDDRVAVQTRVVPFSDPRRAEIAIDVRGVDGPALTKAFPALAEKHVTGGAGVRKGPWTYEIAMEYALESVKTNNNPDPRLNPFGPGCQETLSQFMAHFMIRRTLSK